MAAPAAGEWRLGGRAHGASPPAPQVDRDADSEVGDGESEEREEEEP